MLAIEGIRAKMSTCLQSIYSCIYAVDKGGSDEQQQKIRQVRYHVEHAKNILDETWPPNETGGSEDDL